MHGKRSRFGADQIGLAPRARSNSFNSVLKCIYPIVKFNDYLNAIKGKKALANIRASGITDHDTPFGFRGGCLLKHPKGQRIILVRINLYA